MGQNRPILAKLSAQEVQNRDINTRKTNKSHGDPKRNLPKESAKVPTLVDRARRATKGNQAEQTKVTLSHERVP